MNRFKRILLAVLSAALLSAVQSAVAYGQRTADRQFHFTPSVGGSVAGATGLAADLSFGQYILSSRWDAGVSYGFRSGSASPYHSFTFHGTWLYRVCGTSTRVFSMYCGGGVRAGVDFGSMPADDGGGSGAPSQDDSGVSWFPPAEEAEAGMESKILCGFHFDFEMEVFVSDRTALVGRFRVPLNFNTLGPVCCPETLLGLRFNL